MLPPSAAHVPKKKHVLPASATWFQVRIPGCRHAPTSAGACHSCSKRCGSSNLSRSEGHCHGDIHGYPQIIRIDHFTIETGHLGPIFRNTGWCWTSHHARVVMINPHRPAYSIEPRKSHHKASLPTKWGVSFGTPINGHCSLTQWWSTSGCAIFSHGLRVVTLDKLSQLQFPNLKKTAVFGSVPNPIHHLQCKPTNNESKFKLDWTWTMSLSPRNFHFKTCMESKPVQEQGSNNLVFLAKKMVRNHML